MCITFIDASLRKHHISRIHDTPEFCPFNVQDAEYSLVFGARHHTVPTVRALSA